MPRIGLASPVRGEISYAPAAAPAGTERVLAARLAALEGVYAQDLDVFLRSLAATGGAAAKSGLLPSLAALASAAPPKPGAPSAAVTGAAAEVQATLQGAAKELVALYQDGLVHESEMAAIGRARDGISTILAMRDGNALQMLPRDVRQRLDTGLFGPLATLMNATAGQVNGVMAQVNARDGAALVSALKAPVAYSTLDISARADGSDKTSLRGLDRYRLGDRVAVPRSDGSTSLGVVVGHDPEGLRVEVAAPNGAVGLRTLTAAEVIASNPLKIGDHLSSHAGHEVWITGIGADGRAGGVARDAIGRITPLAGAQVDQIASELIGEMQRLRELRDASVAQAPAVAARSIVRAGGAETHGVEKLSAATATGGLFTSRGPTLAEHGIKYKDYNEDAAVLGVVPASAGRPEAVYAGAFDQAGGMGKVAGQDGAASKIAAECFEAAALKIAAGADPAATLRAAALNGHKAIGEVNQAHHVNAMTTIAAGVIAGGFAHVVNAGDSQVLHFSKDGKLKNATKPHNLGDQLIEKTGDPNAGLEVSHIVTSGLGAGGKPTIDTYRWAVEKGDSLVFVSDGVCDANLEGQRAAFDAKHPWTRAHGDVTTEALGGLVKAAGSAEAATRAISSWALHQMAERVGKPDNTTAVVVRVS